PRHSPRPAPGGRPAPPMTAIARLTCRYSPISLTAVFNIARGVCCRKIFWLISEIFERSRSLSSVYVPVFTVLAISAGGPPEGFSAGWIFFGGAPFGHQFAV